MADSGFSSSSSLSDHSRASPPASVLRDDGEELMVEREAGEDSPQSLASPMDRSVTDSQTSSISTIAAPGAWHQLQHQHRNEESEQLPPSPTESQHTAAPNPFVDLVAGARSQAYRALRFDFASSLSGSESTPSPGSRWEREIEHVTEEVVVPDARRLGRQSDRKREKARAVEPDVDPLPVSPPHGSRSTRRTQARNEEADGSKSKTDEKVKRRRRRVHYYRYTADDGPLEYRFSRDFFLLVWLCLGIACFLILVGRSVRVNAGGLDFETLL